MFNQINAQQSICPSCEVGVEEHNTSVGRQCLVDYRHFHSIVIFYQPTCIPFFLLESENALTEYWLSDKNAKFNF